jgi:D-xylose transport system substrate-binding protein
MKLACGLAVTALGLTGVACGATADSGPAKTYKIAFLMPCSTCADRFEHQDKPNFIEAVQALDKNVQVIANNADGSDTTQIAQAEAALTAGANVLVFSPLNETTGQAIAAKAAAAKVPIISYDGLLNGAKVDFYVSFDNVKVGYMQGQYLVTNLAPGSSVAMINGTQTIAVGRQFKQGAHQALDPAFNSGALKLGYEADTPRFNPATAQQEMEQALTKLNNKVGGVMSANDGMAGGVIAALTAQHLDGKVLVTGQDSTDAALGRILTGSQSMTVYKSIKKEAQVAAQVAVALAKGNPGKIKQVSNTTVDNGAGTVPSDILDPLVITKSNISIVVKEGFTTWDRICAGIPAASCPRN